MLLLAPVARAFLPEGSSLWLLNLGAAVGLLCFLGWVLSGILEPRLHLLLCASRVLKMYEKTRGRIDKPYLENWAVAYSRVDKAVLDYEKAVDSGGYKIPHDGLISLFREARTPSVQIAERHEIYGVATSRLRHWIRRQIPIHWIL